MRKLYLFMMISLDGYFEGQNHNLSWHNADNPEFQQLVAKHASETDAILMGKTTFAMMRDFWTTDAAKSEDPFTTNFMNTTKKYAISHSNFAANWQNTEVVYEDVFDTIATLKNSPGKDIAIFGSNNLCVSLMAKNLVDEFRVLINPIALGQGTPLFSGLENEYNLRLADVKAHSSGNVLVTYTL